MTTDERTEQIEAQRERLEDLYEMLEDELYRLRSENQRLREEREKAFDVIETLTGTRPDAGCDKLGE
jgi:predicted nuclease with TOPRIM domain